MSGRNWFGLASLAVLGACAWWLLGETPTEPDDTRAAVIEARAPDAPTPPALPDAVTPEALPLDTGLVAVEDLAAPEAVTPAAAPEAGPPGGATFVGQVVDVGGRPLPRAEVSGWSSRQFQSMPVEARPAPDRRTECDDAGGFTLWLPAGADGTEFMLEASAPGQVSLLCLVGHVDLDSVHTGLTLTLDTARSLRGRVSTDAGLPVAGAEVLVVPFLAGGGMHTTAHRGLFSSGPSRHRLDTDAQGRFHLEALPQIPCDVTVQAPGFAEWTGVHQPDDPDLDIVLTTGLSLFGEVFGADGAPAEGVTVALRRSGARHYGRLTTDVVTDPAGRFAFHGLEPFDDGYLALRDTATPARHALQVVQPVVLAAPGPGRADVALFPARALAGQVLMPDGTPVPGASVGVVGERSVTLIDMTVSPLPTWENQFPGQFIALTDEQGAFRIDGLYDGLFEVHARHPDEPALSTMVEAAAGSEGLRLVLDPEPAWGVTLSGHVRDALSYQPVTAFAVYPMLPQPGGGAISSPRSDEFAHPEGYWRITGLKAGTMQLTVSAEGYAPWADELREYERGEQTVDVYLLPERSLSLRVVDDRRRPLEGVSITFEDRDERSLMVQHGPNSRTSMLTTDEQGLAAAHGLPAAPVTVELKRGWLGSRQTTVFDLRLPPHGVQEVVYGDGDRIQIAVAVLRPAPGAPPLDLQPTVTPAMAAAAPGGTLNSSNVLYTSLAEGLAAGTLRPATRPSRVRVLDEDGALITEVPLDRSDDRVLPPLAPGPPEAAWLFKVLVPKAPLRLQWQAADGSGPVIEQAWQPDPGLSDGDLVVLLLPPG